MKKTGWSMTALMTLLLLSACMNKEISMGHIHGLGYSPGGDKLLIPAHTGLVAYSQGKWTPVDTPKHDYMGFTVVDNGFYSSGHPELDSGLKNPMGIVRSDDFGKNLSVLALHGETDFHLMAAGYHSHAIYVWNEKMNSVMPSPGLFYSVDEGKRWNQSTGAGLEAEPTSIAAHPTDGKTVSVGNQNGLLLSRDHGNRFELVVPGLRVSSVAFAGDGRLLAAGVNSENLVILDLETKERQELRLPSLRSQDAVIYMAVNPAKPDEIVISTASKDVFMKESADAAWKKIADKGKGLPN